MGYIRVYRREDLIDQMELGRHPLTIGRSEDNRLVLADSGVSRRHAIIFREKGSWYVQDLDSSNGVFVNKQRIARAKLHYWDEIQIHQFVIRFMATAAAGSPGADAPVANVDEDDTTRLVNLKSKQDLERLRETRREAWISDAHPGGQSSRHVVPGSRLSIGSSRQADVRLPGWFTPGEAARIERVANSFRLVPHSRGRVSVDGRPVSTPVLLADGTRFTVRDREFTFWHRTPD